jgi:SAM-dependent methyltransferase
MPGIIRLGDTVQDVPPGMLFDIVTCSHVLEHVADRVSFLREIRGILRTDGRAYFEVPLEIWKDAPIATEPVTHVNFFALPSLTFALARAGYNVLQASTTVGSYGDARLMVIWAVAAPARSAAQPARPGSSETRRLTKPGSFEFLERVFLIKPRLERSPAPILRLPVRIMRTVAQRVRRV